MNSYVSIEPRGYEINKRGVKVRAIWWYFYTVPSMYHVWYRPDGTKTIDQFHEEQTRLASEHRSLVFSKNNDQHITTQEENCGRIN